MRNFASVALVGVFGFVLVLWLFWLLWFVFWVFFFFFCFLFVLNRTVNKADYSGFYYYVKAILNHLTIYLMAGNTFLMVTGDKILSIYYSNSNQTAKQILKRCG